MKKIKIEPSTTLTYTPFENIGEVLKQEPKKKKKSKENK